MENFYVRNKMYFTIKLEGNVGTIHSINVDGEEIIPDLRYNIAPHKFVHRGNEGFGLKEAVDKIFNLKKENEEMNKELERRKEEMNKKQEEYERRYRENK